MIRLKKGFWDATSWEPLVKKIKKKNLKMSFKNTCQAVLPLSRLAGLEGLMFSSPSSHRLQSWKNWNLVCSPDFVFYLSCSFVHQVSVLSFRRRHVCNCESQAVTSLLSWLLGGQLCACVYVCEDPVRFPPSYCTRPLSRVKGHKSPVCLLWLC